ncbi:SDR family oxidoreductase [Scytonema sp. PCC 10023]|uniref:SDR family oxidoreductase n=1 Tax=Scytonema sp. PCC 10023 TaxID=1680591 RepID=UPI0039C5FDD9
MKKLAAKIALITGGSSGIGRATAVAFAEQGATVIIAGRRVEEGSETVRLVKQAGGDGLFVKTDVTKVTDINVLVNKTVETYGRLDYAFNNAGVEGTIAPITEQTEEDFEQVFGSNVKGVWLCMKYEIEQMLKQGGGAIVNMASVAGFVGSPNMSIYSASKHAVLGLTKAAALEVAKSGIRVNAVSPGGVETDMQERITGGDEGAKAQTAAMHPIGRIARPEEIAAAVVWLCSDAASFVTGQSLNVDGGATV